MEKKRESHESDQQFLTTVKIKISELLPNYSSQDIFPIDTPIFLSSKREPQHGQTKYNFIIGHPVKSIDLHTLLLTQASGDYSTQETKNAWEKMYNIGEGQYTNALLNLLWEGDDTIVIENISKRLLAHDTAWNALIHNVSIAKILSEALERGDQDYRVADFAVGIREVMMRHPEMLKTRKMRDKFGSNKLGRIAMNKFKAMDEEARADVFEKELEGFKTADQIQEIKRKRILFFNNATEIDTYDGRKGYLCNKNSYEEVTDFGNGVIMLRNAGKKYHVVFNDEGEFDFDIYSRNNNYLIPGFSWVRKDSGWSELSSTIVSIDPIKEVSAISTSNPNTRIIHPVQKWHINTILGVLVLSHLSGEPIAFNRKPYEVPLSALEEGNLLLESKVIQNAQRVLQPYNT